jgi:hypothetical protein
MPVSLAPLQHCVEKSDLGFVRENLSARQLLISLGISDS